MDRSQIGHIFVRWISIQLCLKWLLFTFYMLFDETISTVDPYTLLTFLPP